MVTLMLHTQSIFQEKKTLLPPTWEYVDSGFEGLILICKFWACLGKVQGGRFVLAFEVSESAWYEVGVRSNRGGNRIGSRRINCNSIGTMNYLQGGCFESEYLDQFHIWVHTHTHTHTHTRTHLLSVIYYKLFWLLKMDRLDLKLIPEFDGSPYYQYLLAEWMIKFWDVHS